MPWVFGENLRLPMERGKMAGELSSCSRKRSPAEEVAQDAAISRDERQTAFEGYLPPMELAPGLCNLSTTDYPADINYLQLLITKPH